MGISNLHLILVPQFQIQSFQASIANKFKMAQGRVDFNEQALKSQDYLNIRTNLIILYVDAKINGIHSNNIEVKKLITIVK